MQVVRGGPVKESLLKSTCSHTTQLVLLFCRVQCTVSTRPLGAEHGVLCESHEGDLNLKSLEEDEY